MARSPFVVPSITRLTLADGEWIDVKGELTAGEQRDMFTSMRRELAPGQPVATDFTLIARARMHAYVLGWSFTDPDGVPVGVSEDAFDQLKIPVFEEIDHLIDEHDGKVRRRWEDEKKTTTGASGSALTLQSV